MGARPTAKLGVQARMEGLLVIDNTSPPGSWANELRAAPWGYGQRQIKRIEDVIHTMRQAGLWAEATFVLAEIAKARQGEKTSPDSAPPPEEAR